MFESIVNLLKSISANSNIRCYFKSNCCKKNQASEPQEIKSKISRIIHLWNMKETHRNINKVKIPWRKIITV